ncbi:hypothetical protein E1A91_A10G258100v1 [Gossypium mustelinum]|uniref:ADP-ribosyl cyclase/cyclic ADP-ribose hydrolase n=1 Tax=Gossypium mustelinum TaxID=34275 RepID=A0A5D2XR76_GOSMU|nr:hypothetical protein E1A91_A10G258100v1 [Gossypium mustelinum]
MASSSAPPPPPQVKHQVFLSFRGEDTRNNFTSHLLKALKDTGLNVFFDEEKLEKGEKLSDALSQAIAASNLSILVLSKDYASSKSCLGELSDIMDRKRKPTDKHIALPIFYHVDPSHVRNIGETFKTSFEEHESKRPVDEVKRWKVAFTEVGTLKGWHIEGGKFDRSETEYIKDVVEYVLKKLNSNCTSVSEDLVGIDDQKRIILGLIEQADSRVIGLWGMGGIGKTTLADIVYKEVSPEFESRFFLRNVSKKIKDQGDESLRNDLLSKLLKEKEICVDTPSIGYPYNERLNNKSVLLVLDDISDPDQIDFMGVTHFGPGSKIIVTSRDRQILNNGGADKIHEVKKLNANDSLQLFSTFAFKQLNPAVDFRDLSRKFVKYAQGSPLALKVCGSTLYKKSRKEWESEVDKLRECAQPKILQILESSFNGLDEIEKNIFLDIAIFFKGERRENVEEILNCCYKGVDGVIRSLLDKSLLDTKSYSEISMHDMLEEMGRDIVRQESRRPQEQSRLWNPKDVDQVLKYNKGTDLTKGIKVCMSPTDVRRINPTAFQNMHNLRFIYFSLTKWVGGYAYDQVDDIAYLPNELRCLCWDCYPFKSLSSNYNPENLVILRLRGSNVEQLWDEDKHQDLVNLRHIDISYCKKLRKIPNLLRAINLKTVICSWCDNLVEIPCLDHLESLDELEFEGCCNLKMFPKVPNIFSVLDLSNTGIEEVPDSIGYLDMLECLDLSHSKVQSVSSNILKLKNLDDLDLSYSMITKFPETPKNLTSLNLSGTKINEVSLSSNPLSNLRELDMGFSSIQKLQCNIALFCSGETTGGAPSPILRFKSLGCLTVHECNSLKLLSELPPYLRQLDANYCLSLEEVSFSAQHQDLYELHSSFDNFDCFMLFSNCFSLNQDSIDNIAANAMLKIRFLAKKWVSKYHLRPPVFYSYFPGNEIPSNKFEHQSNHSSLTLKIAPNGCSGSRFLVFSICLVADLTELLLDCSEFICECQLTAASGARHEKFKSVWQGKQYHSASMGCMGDHVLILFGGDMVKKDEGYEQASFEFYLKYLGEENMKVKKCGVDVSYVDEEPKPQSTT